MSTLFSSMCFYGFPLFIPLRAFLFCYFCACFPFQGCGVVEFETADQAQEAIEKLTDTELKDRKIFVREDREDDTRNRRSGGNNYYRGGRVGFSRGSAGYPRSGYGK